MPAVWTDPITWEAEQLVTKDQLNAALRDCALFVKQTRDTDGKIPALSSTYFTALDGSQLTGIVHTAAASVVTDGVQDFGGTGGRIVIPAGSDLWAT